QLRLDGGTARNGWTVFAYGARDELDTVAPTASPDDANPPLAPSLILGFHRLDLRLHHTYDSLVTSYRAVFGHDNTCPNGTDLSGLVAEPSLRATWKPADAFSLTTGVEGSLHRVSQGSGMVVTSSNPLSTITSQLGTFQFAGALAEALWRPTRDWLI